MLRTALTSLALVAAVAAPASAELNLAPGAHLTASSWAAEALLVEKRDDIPRNAVDGSPDTVWRPDTQAPGDAWIKLDFTRPWPMRYAWTRVVARWAAPPRTYRWQVSRDGRNWETLASVARPTRDDGIDVAGTGPYLRILFAKGDEARLAEVEAYAGSGGAGELGALQTSREANRVRLDWSDNTLRNVFAYRLLRTATLGVIVTDTQGTAGVTSLVAEGPMLAFDDRVTFPNETGLDVEHQWIVEAYAPDGSRIATARTERAAVTARSPNPFLLRGIVEGYYGPAYSDAEREDLVRFAGNHGANYYLYAPKLDPYHRDKWREPYPAEYAASLERLLTVANDHGVTFAWSLSPGLDYDGSAADKAAALAKFRAMQKLGVNAFAVLWDDIEAPQDVTAAAMQVELVNHLLAELRKSDSFTGFLFVPTVYRGRAETLTAGQKRYLQTLAALDPSVHVMWTGSDVFTAEITLADVAPIAALAGRPLVIWDNYPVADFFLGRRVNLGAVAGRGANLADGTLDATVVGLLANPMWLPAANRLPLATVFDYLGDPAGYDPAASLAAQVAREAPPELRDLFARWAEAFATFPAVGLDESAATRAVSEATEALRAGRAPGRAFAEHAAALYVMGTSLARLYNPDLAGELLPAAAAAAKFGEAELAAIRLVNGQGGAALREAGETAALAGAATGWVVTENLDRTWLQDFFASDAPAATGAPRIEIAMPSALEVGDALRATLRVAGADEVTIHGLAGAAIEGGELRFEAGRTGTERWVLVASNAAGANVAYGELYVVEQQAGDDAGCRSGGSFPLVLLALYVTFALRTMRATRPGAKRFK